MLSLNTINTFCLHIGDVIPKYYQPVILYIGDVITKYYQPIILHIGDDLPNHYQPIELTYLGISLLKKCHLSLHMDITGKL